MEHRNILVKRTAKALARVGGLGSADRARCSCVRERGRRREGSGCCHAVLFVEPNINMVFVNPQTARNWKLLTYFATAGTGFYSIFYASYNPEDPREHCFTDMQRAYHTKMNALLGRPADLRGLPQQNGGRLSLPPQTPPGSAADYTNPLHPLYKGPAAKR